jgi:hypothetical protein
MLNTSPDVTLSRRREILEWWDGKMRLSGYDLKFGRHVIKAAIGIYRGNVARAEVGETPLYKGRKL